MTLQKGQETMYPDREAVLDMQKQISDLNLSSGEKDTFDNFWRCINLCHDCIALKSDEKGKEDELVYNGPSVDEVCLLEMSADSKISHFITRDSEVVKMSING